MPLLYTLYRFKNILCYDCKTWYQLMAKMSANPKKLQYNSDTKRLARKVSVPGVDSVLLSSIHQSGTLYPYTFALQIN